MISKNSISQLKNCVANAKTDVLLSAVSQWKVGGSAVLVLKPSTLQEIIDVRKKLFALNIEYLIIGATSNILFDDDGLNVPCLQIGNEFAQVSIGGNKVTAQAGVWIPGLARKLMQYGLTGGEHICGIPGTLGGLVCMNGGSQRKGIGDNVVSVTSVDKFGSIIKRSRDECEFAYRTSVFQKLDEIIVEVELSFESAEDKTKVRQEMISILKSRRLKFPRKEPNCGSVFKSNPAMYEKVGPPGQIIEKLGFKGYRYKSVMVSPLHANFITHDGNGKASDIRELIGLIQSAVFIETGFRMDVEVQFLGANGEQIFNENIQD